MNSLAHDLSLKELSMGMSSDYMYAIEQEQHLLELDQKFLDQEVRSL